MCFLFYNHLQYLQSLILHTYSQPGCFEHHTHCEPQVTSEAPNINKPLEVQLNLSSNYKNCYSHLHIYTLQHTSQLQSLQNSQHHHHHHHCFVQACPISLNVSFPTRLKIMTLQNDSTASGGILSLIETLQRIDLPSLSPVGRIDFWDVSNFPIVAPFFIGTKRLD
jgi:hypothetical protein